MLKRSILRRSSNLTVLFSFPDSILKLGLYGLWKWWIHRERSASSPALILITATSSSLRMIRLYEAPALSVSSTFARRTCKLTLWPSCEPHFLSRFLAARISYVPDVVCSSLSCHTCVYIASSILALVGWSQDDPEEKRATVLNFVRYGAKFRCLLATVLTSVTKSNGA